ncbi:MAG: phosphodiester glycosidase family protein [Lachnospiraceae bacterium]|nr:phosphodiester glycosidase family protein [Lachnospiraceae bacterium]
MTKQKIKTFFIRLGIFILVTVMMAVIFLYSVMWICVHGPSTVVRDIFVMSVRETSAMGFLADLFLTDEEIAMIEERNQVKVTDEITDTSLIKIDKDEEDNSDDENVDDAQDALKYEYEADLEYVDGVAIKKINGSTFQGYMMFVSDPSRVFVGVSNKNFSEDKPGKTVANIMKEYDVSIGINAGGFEDPGGRGDGALPKGLVISEGKFLYGNENSTYEIVGINDDDILVVGKMTGKEAINSGVRDAVCFGPTLIVNGNGLSGIGTGGGLNPRTAIGQRADGTIMLLVIEGRQATSLGASYNDLIRVMLEYGAINAANLDGGSSSVMYYDNELINSNASVIGLRKMPTTILVR